MLHVQWSGICYLTRVDVVFTYVVKAVPSFHGPPLNQSICTLPISSLSSPSRLFLHYSSLFTSSGAAAFFFSACADGVRGEGRRGRKRRQRRGNPTLLSAEGDQALSFSWPFLTRPCAPRFAAGLSRELRSACWTAVHSYTWPSLHCGADHGAGGSKKVITELPEGSAASTAMEAAGEVAASLSLTPYRGGRGLLRMLHRR
jgi:hypothetical protein